jgi:hypothetical protein
MDLMLVHTLEVRGGVRFPNKLSHCVRSVLEQSDRIGLGLVCVIAMITLLL